MGLLFGTDASCSGPATGLFNAFTLSATQGIAQAIGFGETWMHTRGTAASITGTMSGFLESGSNPGMSSLTTLNRTGSTVTFTFNATGDSISFTGVMTGVGLDVQYLGNQTMSVSFVADGAPSVSWT